MCLTLRRCIGAGAILTATLMWWQPEPRLIQAELVDWAAQYEQRFTPRAYRRGALPPALTFSQENKAPIPLTRYIDQEGARRAHQADSPEWDAVFMDAQKNAIPGERTHHYARLDQKPFTELDSERGIIEWRSEQGILHMRYLVLESPHYGKRPIPDAIRYPWRQHGWVLLFGVLVVAGWGFTGRAGDDRIAASTAAFAVRLTAVCAVLLSGLLIWPFLYGSFGSDASYFSITIGVLLCGSALICLWIFRRQVVRLTSMIHGSNRLAYFTFTDEEWACYASWDHARQVKQKSKRFAGIFGLTVLIGVIVMMTRGDEASVIVFAFVIGFMALMGLLIWQTNRASYRRNLRPGPVYIAPDAVYINGAVHTWNHFGARLESAEFLENPLPHIRLVYSQSGSADSERHEVEVRVPVPDNQREEGQRVAQELKKKQA